MFGKLFKYDLKYLMRYWWMLALVSFCASIFGSICMASTQSEIIIDKYPMLIMFSFLGIMSSMLIISGFLISTEIFVFIRFYKHLFSDEGYLTFTLPVKRHTLLNSKLASAALVQICTFTLYIVEMFILYFFSVFSSELITFDMLKQFWTQQLAPFLLQNGGWIALYLAEIIAILCIAAISGTLLIYICITFASVMIKKLKVLAAIGIYYVASYIISFLLSFVYIFAGASIIAWFTTLSPTAALSIGALGLLVIIAVVLAATLILYTIELWLLDRKLNLS